MLVPDPAGSPAGVVRKLGADQFEGVVGTPHDPVGELDGESDRVNGWNEFRWRWISERNGSVVAGLDDHLQRRLENVEDRFGHTQTPQRIQQRQLGGRDEIERGIPVLLRHRLGRAAHILVGLGIRKGSRVRPYLGNLLGKWAVPVGGVRVDDAEDGVQASHRVDRKLWKIGEEQKSESGC